MADTFSKETECLLCKESYSPVIEPEEGQSAYKLYCSSCTNWHPISRADVVRATLKGVLELKGEALALALQSVLAPCPCGEPFNHDAGQRCPTCIDKIERENRRAGKKTADDFYCPWNIEELKKLEPKIIDYIANAIAGKEETLTGLIEKYENGEIDAETYLEGIEDLQFRESRQISVIQTWAIILGHELAFRMAEEHGLVEKYGTRILVSIASGLEKSTGRPVLATLSKEKANWDGDVQKELKTFLAKIGGGF